MTYLHNYDHGSLDRIKNKLPANLTSQLVYFYLFSFKLPFLKIKTWQSKVLRCSPVSGGRTSQYATQVEENQSMLQYYFVCHKQSFRKKNDIQSLQCKILFLVSSTYMQQTKYNLFIFCRISFLPSLVNFIQQYRAEIFYADRQYSYTILSNFRVITKPIKINYINQ